MNNQRIISVLHVNNNRAHAKSIVEALDRGSCQFQVRTVSSASEALLQLNNTEFDCIVSGYNIGSIDGIEFLKIVRRERFDMPFILFPEDGSESIASEAVSAGVTDYIQGRNGAECYGVLESRINDTIDNYQFNQRRQRWADVAEAATEGIAIVDQDGQILQINSAFSDAYGEDPSDLADTNYQEWYIESEITRFESDIFPVVRKRGEWCGESMGIRSDGTIFKQQLTVSSHENHRYIFVIQNTPDNRRQKRSLNGLCKATRDLMQASTKQGVANEAVEVAKSVLDHDVNAVWLHNEGDNALKPAAITDAGSELIEDIPVYTGGKSISWKSFQDGEMRVYDDVRGEAMRVTDDTPIRSEIVIPLGDHGVMNIGSTKAANFDKQDISLARIFGNNIEAALDCAMREQQARERRMELEEKTERLEEFTGIVSHDLRNPLNIAKGRLELAQEETDSDNLEIVEDALTRMEALIDDLLRLSCQSEQIDEYSAVSLSDLVMECWNKLDTADAALSVKTEMSINADVSLLRQAIQNLLSNAIEHSDAGVYVQVGELDDGFYIADNGPGIPSDQQEAVFEPGFTTADDGTGFGMNIVKKIIHAHQWDIEVTESANKGTRFEITGVSSPQSEAPRKNR